MSKNIFPFRAASLKTLTVSALCATAVIAASGLYGQDKTPGAKLTRTVNELIQKKGDINQRFDSSYNKSDSGIPLLIWAVGNKNPEAVEILLKNGADPNIEPMKGSTETALFEVSYSISLENDAKKRDELCAVTVKICELLIKSKADVNFTNKIGGTPLHKAAVRGRDDICRILATSKANVNAQDKLGSSPLHQAAKYGYWKAVEVLLKNKADANAKDKLGKTPLQVANERFDEKTQKEMRSKFGAGYYTDADYDKTIQLLKTAGAK